MGLILDTNVVIAAERRRESVAEFLRGLNSQFAPSEVGISTVTAVELTQGIHHGRDPIARARRKDFCAAFLASIRAYELTLEIAQLAGRIEAEQAALGINIPFEDLLIGATALHLGFSVATHNDKHFRLIPGLQILTV